MNVHTCHVANGVYWMSGSTVHEGLPMHEPTRREVVQDEVSSFEGSLVLRLGNPGQYVAR